MAVFKCKMCGGGLEIAEDVSIVKCDYCGTNQTIPMVKDEGLQNLFNRANIMRIKGEFDKAENLYEKIIQTDETQAEAYWGLILCKYGIEYIEDPKTFQRIPTCHRTSYEAVVADENYKQALEYADVLQKGIYEAEAKQIDEIQKGILSIVQNAEPYDVFICYKEKDASGKRTQDSVIANDIYYQLTQEGFKVFYAAITLEDKLGSVYEPIIFAALNSAKVMLAIGTKPEYFNAVWVKNEWSRYLKLTQKDRSRTLIPCYRDMDAYDLPEEFAHLQAQDMGKIGFINDIVRGIKKVIVKENPKIAETQGSSVSTMSVGNIATLLKRVTIFLSDGDWKSANEYSEKVLDIDPENALAYLGKLMVDLKIREREDLQNASRLLEDNLNYKKAYRFGDEGLQVELLRCNETIRKNTIYNQAKSLMNSKNPQTIKKAIPMFESILDWKDSEKLAQECKKTAEIAEDLRKKMISRVKIVQNYISAGSFHTVGLKLDETVIVEGFCYGYDGVSSWRNIVAISANIYHTVGLKLDGAVVAEGDNYYGQCNVSSWRDMVAISAGCSHTVGLKSDGTVVAEGDNYYGQCNVSSWRNIVAISANGYHTVGLKSDGTVVAVGRNEDGQCNVSSWRDIVAISTNVYHTVGLKSDGMVVAVGAKEDERCNVSNWRDIIAISAGCSHTVGLKLDGTVVAVGNNDDGQCNVSSWRDMVAISAGECYTVGLKSDGTVVVVGRNDRGQCNVSSWKLFGDIKEVEEVNKSRAEKKAQMLKYRMAGVCQYCGERFKGLFRKTCSCCGKPKDY